jgi:hypothetical protein
VLEQCTGLINVERRVLQGDPCSSLLFSLCFNPIMLTIKQPRYATLGYFWSTLSASIERSWMQFADDALIVASNDKNAQILLNVFVAWCKWSDMLIRIDKCSTFGLRKDNSVYGQYFPSVYIDGTQIPHIGMNHDFINLGKYFNFNMNKDKAKTDLMEKLKLLLSKITNLNVRPQMKLKILKLAIYSKLRFDLKIYDFAHTWICNELDSVVCYHIRKWLELPISSCVSQICRLPLNKCGLNIPSLVEVASMQRLSTRYTMKNSSNSDIKRLWLETSSKNIITDEHLLKNQNLNILKRGLTIEFENSSLKHVETLTIQGTLITEINKALPTSQITKWSNAIKLLTTTLFQFSRKALQQQLPTSANLLRWGKATTAMCSLCQKPQTNKHVLNNCSSQAALERYKIRHDAALLIICNWLKQFIVPPATLHADIHSGELRPVEDVFDRLRPDIVVVSPCKIQVLELTICHESNFDHSKDFKTSKYANLKDERKRGYGDSRIELFC